MFSRNMKDLQWITMKLFFVSLVSIGLLFVWAIGAATGVLKSGHGCEPAFFWLSMGATMLFSLLGLISFIAGEIIFFYQSRFKDEISPPR